MIKSEVAPRLLHFASSADLSPFVSPWRAAHLTPPLRVRSIALRRHHPPLTPPHNRGSFSHDPSKAFHPIGRPCLQIASEERYLTRGESERGPSIKSRARNPPVCFRFLSRGCPSRRCGGQCRLVSWSRVYASLSPSCCPRLRYVAVPPTSLPRIYPGGPGRIYKRPAKVLSLFASSWANKNKTDPPDQ